MKRTQFVRLRLAMVRSHIWPVIILARGRCMSLRRGHRAQQEKEKEKDMRQTPVQLLITGSSHDGGGAERLHD